MQLLWSPEIDFSIQSLCSSSTTANKVSFCSAQSILALANTYLTAIYPYNSPSKGIKAFVLHYYAMSAQQKDLGQSTNVKYNFSLSSLQQRHCHCLETNFLDEELHSENISKCCSMRSCVNRQNKTFWKG